MSVSFMRNIFTFGNVIWLTCHCHFVQLLTSPIGICDTHSNWQVSVSLMQHYLSDNQIEHHHLAEWLKRVDICILWMQSPARHTQTSTTWHYMPRGEKDGVRLKAFHFSLKREGKFWYLSIDAGNAKVRHLVKQIMMVGGVGLVHIVDKFQFKWDNFGVQIWIVFFHIFFMI